MYVFSDPYLLLHGFADTSSTFKRSSAAFHDIVAPLAEMTKLTYTSTNGSYYNKSDDGVSPDGWTRVTGVPRCEK